MKAKHFGVILMFIAFFAIIGFNIYACFFKPVKISSDSITYYDFSVQFFIQNWKFYLITLVLVVSMLAINSIVSTLHKMDNKNENQTS